MKFVKAQLAGKRFGQLLVLHESDVRKTDAHAVWKCKCDCGNICDKRSNELKKKASIPNCGKHPKYDDLTGKIFGRLTVINFESKDETKPLKNNKVHWKCKCSCGVIKIVSADSLRGRHTQSCGCLVRDRITKPIGIAAKNRRLTAYKNNAMRNNREWSLTDDQAVTILQQNCHYCGLSPSLKTLNHDGSVGFICNGIDRVDSLKGYRLDNCLPACKECNIAKNTTGYTEFINWIERVWSHIKNSAA